MKSEQKLNKNVPVLRFPEFKDEWKETKLGKTGKFIGGGTPSTKKPKYWNGTIPWISSSDLKENEIDHININRWITQEAVDESATKVVPRNSIIIVSRVGVGKIAVNKMELCTSQDFTSLVPFKDETKFLAFALSNALGEILSYNQGTSIKGFVKSDLEDLRIVLPSKPEQQKIASSLSSVDGRLQQLQQQHTLLEQYKKGCMQQLFSQQLQFKNSKGKAYPDWEQKELGQIAMFSKGKNISKNDIVEDGAYPCIRYGELYTTYSEIILDALSRTNLPKEDLVFSNFNDVIIPSSGETQIDIAKASCILKNDIALGGDLNIIRTGENGVFLAYYLNNEKKLEIAALAQGNSVVHLYAKQLKTLNIVVPCIEEQTKIANFLSAIDEQINTVKQQITLTQQFKKGLLQQMFV